MSTISQGKAYALEQLRLRRRKNEGKEKIDNHKLHAGDPMYYYCKSCDEEIVLPEDHVCEAPQFCKECEALQEVGWFPESKVTVL